MSGPRAYIVRIYRQGFQSLGGTVEDTATAGTRSFKDVEELARHLQAPIPPLPDPIGEAFPEHPTLKGD